MFVLATLGGLGEAHRHAGREELERARATAWRRTGLPAELRKEFDALHDQLEPTAIAVFQHSPMRHETEITWHQHLLDQVDSFSTPRDS